MKLTPTDLQELQKIVKINEDRLLLMNEIVEHVGKLKNRNSQILLSDEIVKKIS